MTMIGMIMIIVIHMTMIIDPRMVMDGMDVQIIDLRTIALQSIVLQKIDHQNTVHLKVDRQIIDLIDHTISRLDPYHISCILRSYAWVK